MSLLRGKRESAAVYLFDLVLLVWFLGIVFPPLNTLPVKRAAVCIACAFASIFLYLVMRIRRTGTLPLKIILVLTVYFLMILLPYFVGNGVIGNRYMALSLVFLGPVIFDFYRENDLLGHLKVILYIVGAFALVSAVITYYNLLTNSFVSRSIKSRGEHSESLERRGIGGYLLIYFVASVSLPVLFVFLNEKRKRLKKWLFLILYVFCLVFVVKSNYMTAFVTVLFGSLLMVFLYAAQERKTRGKVLLFTVLVAFFIAILNLDKLLALLEGFFPQRIASVLYSNEGEGILQSIFSEFREDRWPTIGESLRSFFNHPLLGLCFSGKIVSNQDGFLVGLGQHSFIADTFALFGILFGVASVWIVFRVLRFYRNERVNALSAAMLLCVFALYFLNNATESIALAVGIVYPLVRELQRGKGEEEADEDLTQEQQTEGETV